MHLHRKAHLNYNGDASAENYTYTKFIPFEDLIIRYLLLNDNFANLLRGRIKTGIVLNSVMPREHFFHRASELQNLGSMRIVSTVETSFIAKLSRRCSQRDICSPLPLELNTPVLRRKNFSY